MAMNLQGVLTFRDIELNVFTCAAAKSSPFLNKFHNDSLAYSTFDMSLLPST